MIKKLLIAAALLVAPHFVSAQDFGSGHFKGAVTVDTVLTADTIKFSRDNTTMTTAATGTGGGGGGDNLGTHVATKTIVALYGMRGSTLTLVGLITGNHSLVYIDENGNFQTNVDVYWDGTILNVGGHINVFGNDILETGHIKFENGAQIDDSDLIGAQPLRIKKGTSFGSYLWLDGGVKISEWLDVTSTEVHHSTVVFQGPTISTSPFHHTALSSGTFDGAVTFGSSVTVQGPARFTNPIVNTSSVTTQGITRLSGPVISTNTFLTASLQTSTATFTGSDGSGNAITTSGGCIKIGATTAICGPGNATYAP